jgi:hypothetical protein
MLQAYFYNNFQDPLNKSVHTPVNNGLQGCPASSATGTTRQNLHHTLHFPSPGSSTPSSDHISTGPNDWSGDYMEQLNSNWQHQQVQHTGNTGIGSYPQLQQHHQRFGIADCLEWRSLAEKDEPAGVAAASGFPAAGGANTGMMMTANSGSPSPAASAAAEGAVLVPRSPDEGSGQLGDAPSRSELSGEGQQASAGVDDGAGTSMGKLHLPLINLKVRLDRQPATDASQLCRAPGIVACCCMSPSLFWVGLAEEQQTFCSCLVPAAVLMPLKCVSTVHAVRLLIVWGLFPASTD